MSEDQRDSVVQEEQLQSIPGFDSFGNRHNDRSEAEEEVEDVEMYLEEYEMELQAKYEQEYSSQREQDQLVIEDLKSKLAEEMRLRIEAESAMDEEKKNLKVEFLHMEKQLIEDFKRQAKDYEKSLQEEMMAILQTKKAIPGLSESKKPKKGAKKSKKGITQRGNLEEERNWLARQKSQLLVKKKKLKIIRQKLVEELEEDRLSYEQTIEQLRNRVEFLEGQISQRNFTLDSPRDEDSKSEDLGQVYLRHKETEQPEASHQNKEPKDEARGVQMLDELLKGKVRILSREKNNEELSDRSPFTSARTDQNHDIYKLPQGNLRTLVETLLDESIQSDANLPEGGINISDMVESDLRTRKPGWMKYRLDNVRVESGDDNKVQEQPQQSTNLKAERIKISKKQNKFKESFKTKDHIEYVQSLKSKSLGIIDSPSQEDIIEERDMGYLERLFQPLEDDSQKDANLKELWIKIQELRLGDSLLVPKYVDLLAQVSSQTDEPEMVNTLGEFWEAVFISYEERINILESLNRQENGDNFNTILNAELDFLQDFQKENPSLLQKMAERENIKARIRQISLTYSIIEEVGQFNQQVSSLFRHLLEIDQELLRQCKNKATEKYQEMEVDGVRCRGILLRALIKLDFWEDEYLQRVEGEVQADKQLAKMDSRNN